MERHNYILMVLGAAVILLCYPLGRTFKRMRAAVRAGVEYNFEAREDLYTPIAAIVMCAVIGLMLMVVGLLS